jgi:glycerophosphoryl diester phosphodiesterase
MAIYAHRGASIEQPENTLAAFRRAIEIGAPGIELDVHLSADGVPVVIHDETVDRTTNGTGKVSDLTVAELQRLDAGNGERIPTFRETLDVIAGHSKLDIEVKASDAAAAVLAEIANYPQLEWLISSFRWESLEFVREQDPSAELWVLAYAATNDAIAMARKLGASALNLHYKSVNKVQIDLLKPDGIDVGVWTVNDVAEAERLRDIGVIAICSDDPEKLRNVYA